MLKNYLMMAAKVYWRRKMFTVINLMCIVLTLVVLLVVTALMQHSFAPSGVDINRDRIVTVSYYTKFGKNMTMSDGLGYKLIERYLKPIASAERVSAVTRPMPAAVYQDDRVEKLNMRFTDAIYWEIYRYRLLEGRVLQPSDIEQGRSVVVLNKVIARKLFGESNVLGKKLNVRSHQYEVIGVVDDGQKGSGNPEMWAPHSSMSSSTYKDSLTGDFFAVLMSKSVADLPALKKEVLENGKRIVEDDPSKWTRTLLLANTQFDSFARGFSSDSRSEESGAEQVMAWILVLMFLFMLLPALNLVNLNLGRMMERSAEIGVRKAFGASTLELVKQFLIENIVLSIVGCLFALILTHGFLLWVNHTGFLPNLNLGVNLSIFAYGLLITVIFGIVSGVVPAWRMARLDPVYALKGNA
nr:ABC transporter permease [uncultured Undibacterium sp.]